MDEEQHPAHVQRNQRCQPHTGRMVYTVAAPGSSQQGYGSFAPAGGEQSGQAAHGGQNTGEGEDDQMSPPSYASIVKGDNKVQH